MASVVFQNWWQQKHPTPSQGSWEFHFHPAGLPPEIRQAITALDVGLAGAPLSAWILGPGFAVWLRSFTAIVPSEQRRYTGLAGTAFWPARGDEGRFAALAPAALRALALPPAEPFAGGAPDAPVAASLEPCETAPVDDAWGDLPASMETARGLAHTLVLGGPLGVAAPLGDGLPRLFGTLLSWLPAAARVEPRHGRFLDGQPTHRAATQPPSARNLLHYLARAWVPPPELAARDPHFPARTWRMVAAVSRGGSLPALFDDLTHITEVWDHAADLRGYLRTRLLAGAEEARCDQAAPAPLFSGAEDAGILWNRVLHYWGRGFLGDDATLARRLATLLAQRVLVDHLVHLDEPADPTLPGRYLRRLRYEALLPHERVTAVLSTLGTLMPTFLDHAGGAS